jgi:hypothetical protein
MVHKERPSSSDDIETSTMKREVSETKVMVETILKALENLGNQAVKKQVDEDIFLRQGIRYKEASKEAKSIQKLREAKDKELQDLRGKCKYLEEHVMALEQGVEMTDLERKEKHGPEEPWFAGTVAHNIYKAQSKGNLPKVVSKERNKARTPAVPMRKYVGLKQFHLCWFCGGNGHKKVDCEKYQRYTEDHMVRRNSKGKRVIEDSDTGTEKSSPKAKGKTKAKGKFNTCQPQSVKFGLSTKLGFPAPHKYAKSCVISFDSETESFSSGDFTSSKE